MSFNIFTHNVFMQIQNPIDEKQYMINTGDVVAIRVVHTEHETSYYIDTKEKTYRIKESRYKILVQSL